MRLDLFLKASRICSGRTLAQKLCDAGLVSINHQPAKSAHALKPDDELAVRTRTRLLVVRVLSLPESRNVPKTKAASLYEVIEDQRFTGDE